MLPSVLLKDSIAAHEAAALHLLVPFWSALHWDAVELTDKHAACTTCCRLLCKEHLVCTICLNKTHFGLDAL